MTDQIPPLPDLKITPGTATYVDQETTDLLLRRRLRSAINFGRQVMANLALLGIAAVLSIMFASSTPARAVIHNSGAGPRASTASGDAPAPSVAIPRGCETSTRPWSAPVGHRQPQADIPPSISFDQSLDQENAKIDHVISGVCRGCGTAPYSRPTM
jgi:hypothetical protein